MPMSQRRPARSRSRRRRIVLVGLVALVIAFGGYLYASSVVYDAISLTVADCGGRFADGPGFRHCTQLSRGYDGQLRLGDGCLRHGGGDFLHHLWRGNGG